MTDVSILHYRTVEGRFPYREWVESIADKAARAAVLARVDRLAFGTFGDWKAVGEGVCELRIHLGAGYRVYFGRDGSTVVILLCGGIKPRRTPTSDERRGTGRTMKRGKNQPAEDQGEWLTEQLRDPELCVAYLNAALAEGDQAAFMLALRNVAKARGGVAAMARETGMNRVALSRALSEAGNPELRSLTKILEASGLEFKVVPKRKRGAQRRPYARARTTGSREVHRGVGHPR